MDRIGGDAGSYFTDNDVPMSERGLPPDRLNFDRNQWDIQRDHPDLQDAVRDYSQLIRRSARTAAACSTASWRATTPCRRGSWSSVGSSTTPTGDDPRSEPSRRRRQRRGR